MQPGQLWGTGVATPASWCTGACCPSSPPLHAVAGMPHLRMQAPCFQPRVWLVGQAPISSEARWYNLQGSYSIRPVKAVGAAANSTPGMVQDVWPGLPSCCPIDVSILT